MNFTLHKCPKCQTGYRASMYGLQSNVGAPFFRCGNCQHVFRSGRAEWSDLSAVGKVIYSAISLVYAVVLGAASVPAVVGAQVILTGNRALYSSATIAFPTVLPYFAVGFFIALTIQCLRIIGSVNRAERGQQAVQAVRWGSPQANPQFFGLMLIMLCYAPVLIDVTVNGFSPV